MRTLRHVTKWVEVLRFRRVRGRNGENLGVGARSVIVNRIYEWARVQPAKAAIICNDVFIDYSFFARTIDSQRRLLSQWDLPVGKTAVVLIPNLAYSWAAILALRSLGLTTVATGSVDSLRPLALRDVACIVFCRNEKYSDAIASELFPSAKFIELPATIRNDGATKIPSPCEDRIPFGDHIVYTSGTTGRYKKILKPGKDVMEYAKTRTMSRGLDATSAHCIFDYPPWTSMGFGYPMASWYSGGCIILDKQKNRREGVFRYNVTHCTVTPSLLQELLAQAKNSQRPRKEFALGVGGGFLSYADAKRTAATLTNNISILYGSTELGRGALSSQFNSPEDLEALTVTEGRVIEIVDDDGAPLPIGHEGQLRVLLERLDATGYMDDEETTAKFFRDGYFYPGDMAIKLPDGRIRLVGRTADVLNIKGWKIAAKPIEQGVQDALNVVEVCTFTGFRADGAEELIIVIEADEMPPQSELQKAGRHVPSAFPHRFANIKRFPRTEGGMNKVNRSALRQMVVAGSNRD